MLQLDPHLPSPQHHNINNDPVPGLRLRLRSLLWPSSTSPMSMPLLLHVGDARAIVLVARHGTAAGTGQNTASVSRGCHRSTLTTERYYDFLGVVRTIAGPQSLRAWT